MKVRQSELVSQTIAERHRNSEVRNQPDKYIVMDRATKEIARYVEQDQQRARGRCRARIRRDRVGKSDEISRWTAVRTSEGCAAEFSRDSELATVVLRCGTRSLIIGKR